MLLRSAYSVRPGLTLTMQQTGMVVVLWLGMLMLPLAPLNTRYSGVAVLLFLAVAFGTRNVLAIGATTVILNLAARLLLPGSSWSDQHWVQWSSISALLTGHSMFSESPLYRFSLSSYMPAGDLFGGLFIALGVQRYWLVWHVLVVCLLSLPLVVAPGLETLMVLIGSCSFYPFVDYTTGGGTLEIAYAVLIAAITLFRATRLRSASLILFAFSAMLRQPSLVLIPFLVLILYQARDFRRIQLFFGALFLFGGIYIVTDTAGAYRYLYAVWDGYHQELFNITPGLQANYSISAIPHALGVPDTVAWYGWKRVYLPLTLLGISGLFAAAWFRKRHEEILFLGILATASVYVLSRGYAQFGYVCTVFFPLIAFVAPAPNPSSLAGRRFAQSLAVAVFWIGATPALLYAASWMLLQVEQAKPGRMVQPIFVAELLPSQAPAALPLIDGDDAHRQEFPLSATVEFRLPRPEMLKGMRLSCDHIPVQELKGVWMPYPTELQMGGAITDGLIEGSEDGVNFHPVQLFRNAATYCNWPVTIPIAATPRPLLAVRLKASKLYLDQASWTLGNVEFVVH